MLNISSHLKAIFLIKMSIYHKIIIRKSLNPYGSFFGTVISGKKSKIFSDVIVVIQKMK